TSATTSSNARVDASRWSPFGARQLGRRHLRPRRRPAEPRLLGHDGGVPAPGGARAPRLLLQGSPGGAVRSLRARRARRSAVPRRAAQGARDGVPRRRARRGLERAARGGPGTERRAAVAAAGDPPRLPAQQHERAPPRRLRRALRAGPRPCPRPLERVVPQGLLLPPDWPA